MRDYYSTMGLLLLRIKNIISLKKGGKPMYSIAHPYTSLSNQNAN